MMSPDMFRHTDIFVVYYIPTIFPMWCSVFRSEY